MIIRWWEEFKNPALKCIRLGHKNITRKVIIRMDSTDTRAVAKDYHADLTECIRCGKRLDPANLEYKTYWTKVEMPTSMFDKMDEQGYVIIKIL